MLLDRDRGKLTDLMAGIRSKRWCLILLGATLSSFLVVASICVLAEPRSKQKGSSYKTEEVESRPVMRALNFFYQKGRVGYKHVWPVKSSFSYFPFLDKFVSFFYRVL